MDAERTYIHEDGTKVEEYYWSRELVCYVDNKLSPLTFNQNVNFLRTGKATMEMEKL